MKGLLVTYPIHLLDMGVIAFLCLSFPTMSPHTRKGQRDQKPAASAGHRGKKRLAQSPHHPGVLSFKAVGKSSQNHHIHRGLEQKMPSSDLGLISNICTEMDHFWEDLLRDHVLLALELQL